MESVNGVKEKKVLDIRGVPEGEYEGKEIRMNGAVYTIRHIDEAASATLRESRGLAQCAYEAGGTDLDIRDLKEESTMEVMGVVKAEERAPQGFEMRLKEIRVLPQPVEPPPLAVSKWKLNTPPETKLSLRPISLRSARERARFKIQEGIVKELRDHLLSQGFTEIRTPEIVARGAEEGSNVPRLKYFNKKVELGQSPQFHKQTMVGIYDRVSETAPMSRAGKHNTARHLNEYTNLDFEIGYIDSSRDVMNMETGMFRHVMRLPEQEYKKELDMLGMTLSEVGRIPTIRFDQARELVPRKYDRKICNPYGLEPEEELLIGRYFKEEHGSDFMFITYYPSRKRLFYVMDDPEDPKFTLGFNLMLRELKVTTGGQRIHDYREIIDRMGKWDIDPEDTASYLMIFKYGTPPHDGLGTGLKRLTVRLLNGQNVRKASMFPRGVTRLGLQGQKND